MISFSLMARTPSSIAKLLRRPSPKITQNHNQQFRDIGNDGYCNDSQDKPQHSSEIVKVICGTIRSKPRWENTLSSDFPDVNFSDSTFLNQLLLHQKNALLSIRLLYWLHSTFGYSPAPSTCSLIFNALVEDKSAKAAKTFLEFTHFVPDPAGLESYMRCLCESRMIKDALQVLDEMKNTGVCPSLETWNCLLLASIKVGNADLVWELYNDMMEFGVVADLDTVSYLIQSFCLDKNVTKGYQLLRQVLKDGYVPHKSAFDKLLFEFILDQKYDRVPALLHIMIAKNIKPDLYTYQQIIHGLCLTRMQREGLFIFNNLKNRGYSPDKIMYTTMIHGLCKMKWITDARKLWFEMIEKGIEPNHYTYNTLLYGYFRIGHIEMAQNLYKEMKKEYKETLVTYNTMINGLSSHGKTMEAFQLFNQMETQNICKDVITYNSLIKGFCKEGKLTEGLTLLRELIDQGLQPSSASYGPIIGKLYELGRMSEVKILWDEMQDKGVEPAAPCIDEHIIIGMSNKGYIETGVYWLEYMVHNRLVPCQGTFEKLIAILCQKDKLDVGSSVFGHMFKIGYTPSSRMKDLSLMGANSFGSSLIV